MSSQKTGRQRNNGGIVWKKKDHVPQNSPCCCRRSSRLTLWPCMETLWSREQTGQWERFTTCTTTQGLG